MQTSIYLARLIGPTFLVIGLSMLVNRDGYRAMAREFLASRALIYLAGLLALVPGIAMVLVHNVWTGDWRVILTIFAWLATIGGIFRLIFPQQVTEIGNKMVANENSILVGGIVVLALGAILTYFGFFG